MQHAVLGSMPAPVLPPVRKAQPPRPFLMVGDEAACLAAFTRMEAEALALRASGAGAAAWEPLVPRFRSLRESLTSEGVTGALALQAYEASADVCLAAGDSGEYLKCQQRLLTELFPVAAKSGGSVTRWAEFAAARPLFFACAAGPADWGEVSAALRAVPPALMGTLHLRLCRRALGALQRRDGAAFCAAAVHPDATPLLALLMARALPAARRDALAAAGKAFHTLPCAAAARMLQVPRPGLFRELQLAAAACQSPPLSTAVAAWREEAAQQHAGEEPHTLRFITPK